MKTRRQGPSRRSRNSSLMPPTERSLDSIVQTIIAKNQKKIAAEEAKQSPDDKKAAEEKKATDIVKIDPIPANSPNSLAWILFLLPTFVVLVFFYLMMRRAHRISLTEGSGQLR